MFNLNSNLFTTSAYKIKVKYLKEAQFQLPIKCFLILRLSLVTAVHTKLVCTAALAGTLPDHHWWIRSCSVTNQIDRLSCKKGSSGFSS